MQKFLSDINHPDTLAKADAILSNLSELERIGAERAANPNANIAVPNEVKGKDALLLLGLQLLHRRQAREAARYFNAWQSLAKAYSLLYPLEHIKCVGLVYYGMGAPNDALQHFARYAKDYPLDEDGLFYKSVTEFMLGYHSMARATLEQLFANCPYFPEAEHNLKFFADLTATDFFYAYRRDYQWNLTRESSFNLPIFINARDRLLFLQRLVDWLLAAGYTNIYILDNASTYPPLHEYYGKISQDGRVRVLRLAENLGHNALYKSRMLKKLNITVPYVYTDPDVLPVESCPKDLVWRLAQVLMKHPYLEKAGAGIKYDDLTFWDKERYSDYEANFYYVPLADDVYFAPVDTTFALYKPTYHYCMMRSVRTKGELMVRHLPYYLDRDNLPPDEVYYMEHALVKSATLTASLKKQGQN